MLGLKEMSFFQDEKSVLEKSFNMGFQPMTNTIERIEITDSQEKPGFINYRILTEYSGMTIKHVDTMRRYSQFQKLHIYFKYIFAKDKVIILPKFPGKHGITDFIEFQEGSKDDFINERKEDLQIYLTLLISNNKIREDPILKQFLGKSSIEKLIKQIEISGISVPSTAPEKIVHTIKQTFQSAYKLFESWNTPTSQAPNSLKQKIKKIEQIKMAMGDLLSVEMQRLRCIKIKEKELYNLKNGGGTGILKSITQFIKPRIISSSEKEQENSNCLPCVQKLYNYMDSKFKEEKQDYDKIQIVKKSIKLMIGKCDGVLVIFSELVSDKTNLQETNKKLEDLNKLIDQDKFVTEATSTLEQYEEYYRVLNKMQHSHGSKIKTHKLEEIQESNDNDEN